MTVTTARYNKAAGSGQFVAKLGTVERDAEAWQMRCRGKQWEAIAEALGFNSRAAAYNAAMRARTLLPKETVEEISALMLMRATERYSRLREIAERRHPLVSHGRVMLDADGEPMEDSAPVVQALAAMRAEDAEVRKLLGTDAPTKVSVDANKAVDEIASLLAELVGVETAE